MNATATPLQMLARVPLVAQRWPDLAARDFRRILILKPSAVGDIVRALSVLTALRRRYPRARIDWLVARHCADVLVGHPALSHAVFFDRHHYARIGASLGATRAFARFLADLRGAKYDLVIDLQGLFRSGFFALASGSPVRVGRADARELTGIFYTHRAAVDERRMHALVLAASMVAPLDVRIRPCPEDLYIAPHAIEAARRILRDAGLASGERYVIIAPGSNWPTKNWPAERFGQIARCLRRDPGLRPVIVGTRDQTGMASAIRQAEPSAIDLCGRSSLAELVAVTAGAALLIGNDSGPLHIADALDMPLVGIFGPTRPEIVGPFQRPDGVVRAGVKCLGCGIRRVARCPNEGRCMQAAPVEAVVARAVEQLARPPRRHIQM